MNGMDMYNRSMQRANTERFWKGWGGTAAVMLFSFVTGAIVAAIAIGLSHEGLGVIENGTASLIIALYGLPYWIYAIYKALAVDKAEGDLWAGGSLALWYPLAYICASCGGGIGILIALKFIALIFWVIYQLGAFLVHNFPR